MRDELFDELVESIREAGAYLRGEDVPVRVTFVGEPDPRAAADEVPEIDPEALARLRGRS